MTRQGKIMPKEALRRLLFAIVAAAVAGALYLLVLVPFFQSQTKDMLDGITSRQAEGVR